MKRCRWINLMAGALLLMVFGIQPTQGQENLLETYIREGLESNLALQQKEADYRKSLLALDQARSYFYPALRLQARYTRAEGGRIIDFPLGDLLNPVYNTLNLLTGSDLFPQIDNQSFRFYREKEHETKLQLTQPIVRPEIAYRYRISQSLSRVARADVETFRRQLVADIKTAYYGYRKALGMKALLEETRRLLEENLRVNRKLLENHKVNIDAVYRSEAELAELEQKEAEAEKEKQMAAAYFNFLLNREPGTPIETDALPAVFPVLTLEESTTRAVEAREEMEMLDHTVTASGLAVKMHRGNAFPTVTAVVDYGFQGEEYRFTQDDDFVLASLVLSWDLFSGFRNRSEIKQALVEKEKWEARRQEAEREISLEAEQAWYDLEAARKSVEAARKQKTSAAEVFRQVDRRYREEAATQIEWMEARHRLTTAAENVVQAEFDLAVSYARYERATAAYVFDMQ